LVLADDHPIVIEGLEELFRREGDFDVLDRCRSGEETLAAVRKHRPDVLVLDLHLVRLKLEEVAQLDISDKLRDFLDTPPMTGTFFGRASTR
jgi:DNA-binding NarL/FixJ family response regulator